MYLEIDEGFDAHPKTVRLCRVMGDVNAGQYLIRLWAWACRSAPDGNLSGMEAGDIEAIAKYKNADGKLFAALTERWSQKFGAWLDLEGNSLKLHGWEERTGAAISKMDKRAADMRALRDKRKRERDGTVMSQLQHCDTHVGDQTRQDKTSQDQTRQEDSPRARSNPLANEHGKPSPANVVRIFLTTRAQVIGGSVGVEKPFSQPQQSEIDKAERWLSTMSPEDAKDIEPAIRLACEHVRDGVEGWTHGSITKTGFLFGAIVTNWRDLREELHGCAPKVAKPRTVNRPQEEPKTWKIVER